ncbi:hypothetical protein FCV52_13260 [Vibrio kanaloae]|uniref:Uncharacterized protein n=1 Tax=Vibrio kanaloae TaxID=170673 RepID=A0A4U1YYW3_9VIBR|nr:hypothetical protein FCV52_13260 [Vibrio kanaloae]
MGVWLYIGFLINIEVTMARYYVNKNQQANGDHEVHKLGCSRMPLEHNRHYLGDFASCSPAVQAAKKVYFKSNGCFYCSNSCHTS